MVRRASSDESSNSTQRRGGEYCSEQRLSSLDESLGGFDVVGDFALRTPKMIFEVIIPIRLPFALSLDDRRSTFPARLAFLHVGTDPFGLGLVLVTVVHWKIRLAQGSHRELITTLVFQMAPRGQSGAWRGLRH
jgi:hypothetical protein